MKINLLRPNNTTITLDVSKIDAISGIVDGKFDLYAGSLTYTISASEYTRVSNVLGTASSSGGGEESGGMEVVYTTQRDLTLEPNKYYIFGECSTLNINIGEPTTGGKLNEYRFEFDSGSTPTVLTLPNTVNPSTLNILEDTKYVISIKNNVLVEVGSEYSDTSSFLRNILNKTITSIVIPEGVTLIPPYAFYLCRLLISVTLPSTILEIGTYAFYQCSSLVSINLPEGLTAINNYAFYQCTALTNIVFPSTLTFIGTYAFNGCTVLLSPVFPSSLRTIDTNSFLSCRNLSSIVLPTGLPTIWASTFYGCTGLNSVTIPNTVVTLGSSCFSGCSALSSILLPDSVATILQSVFDGCGALKEILMYDSVISITGNYVFRNINGSCRIRIYGTTNVIPFLTNAPATVKFYVDNSMVQAYKTNSAWSARASYIYSLNDYIE